jgi:prevent-host-death family protein
MKNMNDNISVAEAKSHFSKYISKVAYADKRFVITKRNKPIAALVSIDELQKIDLREKSEKESKKFSEMIRKWKDFDEIADDVEKAYRERPKDKGRNVSF